MHCMWNPMTVIETSDIWAATDPPARPACDPPPSPSPRQLLDLRVPPPDLAPPPAEPAHPAPEVGVAHLREAARAHGAVVRERPEEHALARAEEQPEALLAPRAARRADA